MFPRTWLMRVPSLAIVASLAASRRASGSHFLHPFADCRHVVGRSCTKTVLRRSEACRLPRRLKGISLSTRMQVSFCFLLCEPPPDSVPGDEADLQQPAFKVSAAEIGHGS